MQRNSFSKLILILVLLISFCSLSPGFAEDDSEGGFAALSPEFLEWQKKHTEQEVSEQKISSGIPVYFSAPSSEQTDEYIPIPVNFSHLAENPPVEDSETSSNSPVINVKSNVTDSALPSAFDLRNVNGKSYVSSIKSQSPYGTCWAFASLGSMESNYMMQGKNELDLSEMQLSWFTYRNADSSRAFGNYGSESFSGIMDLGGNSFYPAAMFARLDGPTTEAALPYGTTQPAAPNPQSYPRRLRLRDAYYLLMSNDPLNINSSTEQRNIIKRRIMQNGSVVVNYYNDNNLFYKSSSGTTYHTKVRTPTHAVQIIGWDDNFSLNNFRTKPGSNGAWLIKNSWGERWYTKANGYMGDNGCFWMSYESYLTDGTSFVVEEADNNMKVYEYDPLGICELWGYSGKTIYAANVFKAEEDETLTEIGIYTGDNNLGYEINVYTGMSSMPSKTPISGSSKSSSSGTIAFAGYHTITLDTPVSLSKGKYFSVVVKFSGYGMVPVEAAVKYFSENAVIEEGSFFSSNGSSWKTGKSSNVNACIKAFTTTGSSAGIAPKISDNYPPDGYKNAAYSATLTASGTKPITWSVTHNSLPAGLTLDTYTGMITGTPTEKTSQTFTVTAANLYGSDSKNFTMNIWELPSITTNSLEGYAGYAFTGKLLLSRSLNAAWKAVTKMPSGLKLNAKTGEITGKPTKAGEYTVSFTAETSIGISTKDVKFIIHDKPVKPVIKTVSFKKGLIDTAYSQELIVTGTAPVSIKIEGLPNGLSVNSNTGLISGTPTTAGTYSLKITAENLATALDNKPVTKTLKLVINAQPPVLDDASLPDAKTGEAYSYTFTLSSGTEPVTWKASGLPAGIKLSSTGTLSGTPTKAGSFKVNLTVSNAGGKSVKKLPLTVLQAPVITTPKFSAATTDKSYSAKVTAKGTSPISWNVNGLPDTITYSSNASGTTLTIKGTPKEIAEYALTITASNTAGSSSVSAALKVNGVAPKITASLGKGKVDSQYTGSKISATGTKPITFDYSISESDKTKFGINSLGDLGLSFNYDADAGTASITGTPTRSFKTLPITVSAVNAASNGKPAAKTLKLTVAGVKPAFKEPSASAVNIKTEQKTELSVEFEVTGTPDITFTMSNASGFKLTKTGTHTATLSGTAPSKDGKLSITITASNADGKAAKKVNIQTFTPPSITTSTLSSGTLNKTYSSKLAATGTKTIKWTIAGTLPSGMKFSNGSFTGKPKEAGVFAVNVTAANEIGTDAKDFTITVIDPNNVTSIPEKDPAIENHDLISESEETEAKAESEAESESGHSITFGEERNSALLSAGQSEMLNDEGYVIAAVLPEIKASESAMYDIDVELDEDVETGAKLFWFSFPKDRETTSDDEIAEFYDEDGAEIETVPESHKITTGVWLTEGITYEPVIAVKSEK